jgi:hypothetical protein
MTVISAVGCPRWVDLMLHIYDRALAIPASPCETADLPITDRNVWSLVSSQSVHTVAMVDVMNAKAVPFSFRRTVSPLVPLAQLQRGQAACVAASNRCIR